MKSNIQQTHLQSSKELIGEVVSLQKNEAVVQLAVTEKMAVDEFKLAHGGFVFGLADYAAMLAVNEPTVVLGKAETKFIKPVVVGDVVIAEAKTIGEPQGKKITVSVLVKNQEEALVFEGEFVCFVLEKHILEK